MFVASLKSVHSTRMCLTVSGHWQVVHSGWSAPVNRSESVHRVWPILSLLMTTSSRRGRDNFYWWPLTVGLIACNLFPLQLFQNCCRFLVKLLTRRGDYVQTLEVLQSKEGSLRILRKPMEEQALSITNYGPCPGCYRYLVKSKLWRH